MRDYAQLLPTFWTGTTGKEIRKLGRDCQVLALYLMSAPLSNMIGLYYIPIPTICHETGIPEQGACKALRSLQDLGFAFYSPSEEVVWVPEMARYQVADELKVEDNRVKGIAKEVAKLSKSEFFQEFMDRYATAFHLKMEVKKCIKKQGACKPLRSQEQEQEQEQDQKQEEDCDEAASGSSPHSNDVGEDAKGTAKTGEPDAGNEPVAGDVDIRYPTFKCAGGKKSKAKTWRLTDELMREWAESFPAVDIEAECRKAWQWVKSKPARRKTADGMEDFLRRWIAKTQNDGGSRPPPRRGGFAGADSDTRASDPRRDWTHPDYEPPPITEEQLRVLKEANA